MGSKVVASPSLGQARAGARDLLIGVRQRVRRLAVDPGGPAQQRADRMRVHVSPCACSTASSMLAMPASPERIGPAHARTAGAGREQG